MKQKILKFLKTFTGEELVGYIYIVFLFGVLVLFVINYVFVTDLNADIWCRQQGHDRGGLSEFDNVRCIDLEYTFYALEALNNE